MSPKAWLDGQGEGSKRQNPLPPPRSGPQPGGQQSDRQDQPLLCPYPGPWEDLLAAGSYQGQGQAIGGTRSQLTNAGLVPPESRCREESVLPMSSGTVSLGPWP